MWYRQAVIVCSFEGKNKEKEKKSTTRKKFDNSLNILSPNIQKQILPTDLYTFPERMCSENLMKDQSIFFLVIILLILIT